MDVSCFMFHVSRKGFTLIEVLVVATIIGLLAAAGAASYTSLNKNSRNARRRADLENIRAAIEQYRSNSTTNVYPTAAAAPGMAFGTGSITDGSNTYMSKIPKDPKDSTYLYYYTSSGSDYTLGAYLEGGAFSACSGSPSCGTSITCNYCLGPYGQK